MLDIKDSIGKINSTYLFKCNKCDSVIKSKSYYLKKHSGLCRVCCAKKEEFLHIFNRLKNTAENENKEIILNFKQFKEFTQIKSCHYCLDNIVWNRYAYKDSEYYKGGYFLDRKDNDQGYSVNNCVVCCTKCNMAKGNRYTYSEWYGMTDYFRKKLTTI